MRNLFNFCQFSRLFLKEHVISDIPAVSIHIKALKLRAMLALKDGYQLASSEPFLPEADSP